MRRRGCCPRPFVDIGNGVSVVELTKGQTAIVDTDMVGLLCDYNWFALVWRQNQDCYYAATNIPRPGGGQQCVKMHRLIMGVTDPKVQVDHRFHNTLDNRVAELRVVTQEQNQANARHRLRPGSSAYKGVDFRTGSGRWRARIQVEHHVIQLGVFTYEGEAARAYDAAAIKYFGEFAYLNFPEEHGLPARVA